MARIGRVVGGTVRACTLCGLLKVGYAVFSLYKCMCVCVCMRAAPIHPRTIYHGLCFECARARCQRVLFIRTDVLRMFHGNKLGK